MKKGKATGTSGFSIDFIKVLKKEGEKMVHKMIELIWKKGKMPSEWELNELVPIYKQKGDPLECANYRGIKLLKHLLKVTERILDQRLTKLIKIDDMQFGFSPRKGTTDAVFVVKQMQEKHLEGQKDLYFTFVDPEKAYDRVPRDLVFWCLRKRGIPEKLIELVKATYEGAKTTVRTAVGNTLPFEIKVGLHQGSALSPFLFVVVLDTISCELRQGIPWELLFVDDLVVMGETEEMQEEWVKWQEGMERNGLKVNINKTEVMVSSRSKIVVNIKDRNGKKLNQVNSFKYLGVTLGEDGGPEHAVRARIRAAWQKWKDLTGVIYDKRLPMKLKTKVYKTVVRPTLIYGSELWMVRKKEERLLLTTEKSMLRRIKGVTLLAQETNVNIRNALNIEPITDVVRRTRMRWFGHLFMMDVKNKVKEVWKMRVPGKRCQVRSKMRWVDNIRKDMLEMDLKMEDAQNREFWRK